VFYLDVAFVVVATHILQAYVCNCFICFGLMFQQIVYVECPGARSERRRRWPLGRSGSRMRAVSKADAVVSACLCRRMRTAAAGGA
jgi:hypothetical protein